MYTCLVASTEANGAIKYQEEKQKMTPKNMEMGRAGRAQRTMPRIRLVLVIQRPYTEGKTEIQSISNKNIESSRHRLKLNT